MELFVRQGFDETTVDEIGRVVGINRRTLFRYFPSKNDIVWGDFSEQLERLRTSLRAGGADEPLMHAVRRAVLDFNDWGDDADGVLRARMAMITTVPALQAHSVLRYDEWCQVVAEFVAERLGERPEDHLPWTVAQVSLGTAMAAYRVWVREGGHLLTLLDRGFTLLADGFRLPDNAPASVGR